MAEELLENRLAEIRAGLQRLRSLPIEQVQILSLSRERQRYVLNPALTESEIRQFEIEHQIRLPADYRAFLIQLGNGGDGPGYGVFKLGEVVMGWDSILWKQSGYVGSLSEPFPFTVSCKDTLHPGWAVPFDGAIPISHYGCQTWVWLVVTGPESGTVWCDDRGDGIGVYPEKCGVEARSSFLDWYQLWLNDELDKEQRR